jgi:hypothetical protein
VSELEADPLWNVEERDAIARVVASARTSARNWVLPLFVLAAGPVVVATLLRQYRASNGSKHGIDELLDADIESMTFDRFRGNPRLLGDERVRELVSISADLSLFRTPFSLVLAVVLAPIFLLPPAVVTGFALSLTKTLNLVVGSAMRASASAVPRALQDQHA